MKPPVTLLPLFLDDAKEDTWTLLKAFHRRDGNASRLQVVPEIVVPFAEGMPESYIR